MQRSVGQVGAGVQKPVAGGSAHLGGEHVEDLRLPGIQGRGKAHYHEDTRPAVSLCCPAAPAAMSDDAQGGSPCSESVPDWAACQHLLSGYDGVCSVLVH